MKTNANALRLKQAQKLSNPELLALARLESPLLDTLGAWLNKRLTCVHCKRCTRRCEVLDLPALDVGLIEQHFAQIEALPPEAHTEEVLRLTANHPELYHALRQCCFCGHCTATCATHMTAPARMREWREHFMLAGLMPVNDSKIVMVDNEWHIFSAYRAIYGVAYPEFKLLSEVSSAAGGGAAGGSEAAGDSEAGDGAAGDGVAAGSGVSGSAAASTVDTLFFPGCSLVSYAPELVRKIGEWLNGAGYRWALCDECCGSPLMSAGLFERSIALRNKLLDQIRAAGITRVLTICPGCGEELAEVMGDEIDIIPLPELLYAKLSQEVADNYPCSSPANDTTLASVTFFDSCHDRFDTRHGTAVRELLNLCFPQTIQLESQHHGKNTLCCGAGGAVASYDPTITAQRVWRVINEAQATGASTLVTLCPTCTYTIGQALLNMPESQAPSTSLAPMQNIVSRNYLELVFEQTIDWQQVFAQLEAMWTGEYGPWLTETFF